MITCAKAHDERVLADRRDHHQRPDLRAVPPRQRRRSTTATRSAGTRCRRPSRSRTSTSSRRRSSTSTCARTRRSSASTLETLNDLPIVGDVRGDGYFFGIELVKDKATKETFDDDESERLLRGFLSKALFDAGPVLPRRRPRRPRRAARPAAHDRPGGVRRDRGHPARRADRGVDAALSGRGPSVDYRDLSFWHDSLARRRTPSRRGRPLDGTRMPTSRSSAAA